jgi:hypothetical protein
MTYGAVPTLTQSSALAAVPAAPDAGPAVVNAMTNVGISGGALIGARELAAGPVPALALTGAVLVAAALLLHAVPFPRAVPAAWRPQRVPPRRCRQGGTSGGGSAASSGSRDGGFTSPSRR